MGWTACSPFDRKRLCRLLMTAVAAISFDVCNATYLLGKYNPCNVPGLATRVQTPCCELFSLHSEELIKEHLFLQSS